MRSLVYHADRVLFLVICVELMLFIDYGFRVGIVFGVLMLIGAALFAFAVIRLTEPNRGFR